MSKILFISNISNKITSFVTASIEAAHSLDLDFYQAANWQDAEKTQIEIDEQTYNIKIKSVPISRNPLAKTNFIAYKELVAFIKQEGIDYIHCNTPTGGILGRLAGKRCKVKKVIYQAHGFHFYKGAPKLNWLVYYPIEKWLARYTDTLITINQEDFEIAKRKFRLKNNGEIYYVPGVGIDLNEVGKLHVSREEMRASLGLSSEDIVLISAGRLDANKNNETTIRAVAKVPNVKLLLCGDGERKEGLEALAKALGVSGRVFFLGNRTDIMDLYKAADVFVMMSFREGLSRSIMEAMASGLPCIVSKIRGNTDLIQDGVNGYCVLPADVSALADKTSCLAEDPDKRAAMKAENLQKIQEYSLEKATLELKKIYTKELSL